MVETWSHKFIQASVPIFFSLSYFQPIEALSFTTRLHTSPVQVRVQPGTKYFHNEVHNKMRNVAQTPDPIYQMQNLLVTGTGCRSAHSKKSVRNTVTLCKFRGGVSFPSWFKTFLFALQGIIRGYPKRRYLIKPPPIRGVVISISEH